MSLRSSGNDDGGGGGGAVVLVGTRGVEPGFCDSIVLKGT